MLSIFFQLTILTKIDSLGYYTIPGNTSDEIVFDYGKPMQTFIFTNNDMMETFDFEPNLQFEKDEDSDKVYGLNFPFSSFSIKIKATVNVAIWVLKENMCNLNSVFSMARNRFRMKVRPKVAISDNYCIFSPSFLLDQPMTINYGFENFGNSSAYLYSDNLSHYYSFTDGSNSVAEITTPFFFYVYHNPNDPNVQTFNIDKYFEDSDINDQSFGIQIAGTSYNINESYYVVNDNSWTDIAEVSFLRSISFHLFWVWAIVVFISVAAGVFLFLCFTCKKFHKNARENAREEDSICFVPDATYQTNVIINNSEVVENSSIIYINDLENPEKKKDNKKRKQDKSKKDKKINEQPKPVYTEEEINNPYYQNSQITNYTDNASDDASGIAENPIDEINPYSLPK